MVIRTSIHRSSHRPVTYETRNANETAQEDFEAPFLETTRLFYRAESQGFIARNTCPDYMLKVGPFSRPC